MKNQKGFVFCLTLLLVLSLAAACSQPAAAPPVTADPAAPASSTQIAFPEKPLDLTILFGAGSASDVVARKLTDLVTQEIGQTIVANNRVGGGGAVGYQHVLSTDPDGYNIVWNSTSISTTYHQGNMPADQGFEAFAGIANITLESAALAVGPDAPYQTIEEFVAYCQEHPGEVTVANSGVGSFNHLVAAALENAAGISVKHIPMDAKQSTTALLGGQVDAICNMTFDIVQQEQAGQIKTLAVVSEERHALLPEVPTLKESGYDVTIMMYRGIAAPKGTPAEVISKLETAFLAAANSEDFQSFAAQYGVEVKPMGAAEFDLYMAEQDQEVADLMETLGIKTQ
ncbi:MAG: tripartite tricarboxylate transporter substrate binding protein [Gracilibacteraceae bacterium]|jgi:tripartite-type tricarboxylate transporter receptor subunit TctC|nr:tripartite tricarboxylate transporter substrate binding protein [Gracilibacteraceae bacterium]